MRYDGSRFVYVTGMLIICEVFFEDFRRAVVGRNVTNSGVTIILSLEQYVLEIRKISPIDLCELQNRL